jgi:hypothetical protein
MTAVTARQSRRYSRGVCVKPTPRFDAWVHSATTGTITRAKYGALPKKYAAIAIARATSMVDCVCLRSGGFRLSSSVLKDMFYLCEGAGDLSMMSGTLQHAGAASHRTAPYGTEGRALGRLFPVTARDLSSGQSLGKRPVAESGICPGARLWMGI